MATTIRALQIADAKHTAWIFGAGASVFYDIPTQAKIFERLAALKRPGSPAVANGLVALRQKVEELCRAVLPGLPMTDPRLSLEEVFSAYELRQTEPRSTPEEATQAENDLEDLLDAVRQSLCVFGRGDARKWRPHDRDGIRSPYAELIEKLIPATNAPSSPAHTFITFNYDICLDRCLINLVSAARTPSFRAPSMTADCVCGNDGSFSATATAPAGQAES